MRATRALLDVARSPLAAGVGLGAGVAVFLLQVWLPNLGLIWSVVTSGTMSVGERAGFLWDSLGAIHTTFTPLGAWLAGAVSLLFGLNTAVTVRYLRRRLAPGATGRLGLAGLVVALVGVGCSTCGAVVLSFLVGTTATASFVGTLPFGGDELDLLAAAVLAATLAISLRKLAAPVACEPATERRTPPDRSDPRLTRDTRLDSERHGDRGRADPTEHHLLRRRDLMRPAIASWAFLGCPACRERTQTRRYVAPSRRTGHQEFALLPASRRGWTDRAAR